MVINKIKISNILGIESLTFELGKFVEITGKNGTGKTSILESIKGALKSGNDATLLRNGSDQGEVVLVLDDGSNIIRSIKNGKSNLNFVNKFGNLQNKPQSLIDQLIDILSVNPVNFLLADKKNRTKIMLETLDLKVTREEISKAIDNDIAPIDCDRNALDVIHDLFTELYDSRRSYNKDAKEKASSITQLEESLVEIDFSPEEIHFQVSELEEKKENWRSKKDEYLQNIQNETNLRLEQLREKYELDKTEILRIGSEQTVTLNQNFNEKMSPVLESLAQLKERMKYAGAALKTKEMINQFSEEVKTLQNMSNECSKKMQNLDELKLSKLASLPIKGLEVKEGEIYKDGVIFDRLNTAEQIKIAVELAKLRAGTLGIVCIDGLERFDTETYEIFKSEMMKTDLQTIITKVSDDELDIRKSNNE